MVNPWIIASWIVHVHLALGEIVTNRRPLRSTFAGHVSILALALLVLSSCNVLKENERNLPEAVAKALQANGSSSIIYDRPEVTVYVVSSGKGGCGSAGCLTTAFIESKGSLSKIFEGQVYALTPDFDAPGGLGVELSLSGFACGRETTAPHCVQTYTWNGHSLVKKGQSF